MNNPVSPLILLGGEFLFGGIIVEYPVIIEGKRAGTLTVFRQGLYTVYRARVNKRSGLLRLSVYGQGREGRLGLMQPVGDGLYLERRFSEAGQRDFPRRIEFAGPSGQKICSPCPKKEGQGGLLWYRHKNGTLSAFDGKRQLVAIPVRCGLGFRTRCIEGREYAVFFY